MKRLRELTAFFSVLLTVTAIQASITVTFDDLPTPNNQGGQLWGDIPASYDGLNWTSTNGVGDNGWNVDNGPSYAATYGTSYPDVSASNFASNGASPGTYVTGDGGFGFLGAYFASWANCEYPATSVTITGYLNNVQVGTEIVSLPSNGSFVLAPGIAGEVDSISVVSASGTYWRMDNLTYDPVPEPATIAIWGLGAGLAGAAALRRRKQPKGRWSEENRQAIFQVIERSR